MRDRPIVVTQVDARMLRALLAARVAMSASAESAGADQKFLEDLDFELERAVVVDARRRAHERRDHVVVRARGGSR